MLVKVCGLRDSNNICEIVESGADMLGFIFYPPSPRYVGEAHLPQTSGVARVGVFVNESQDNIIKLAKAHLLTHLQLHGSESPIFCCQLQQLGYVVIKAISVSDETSLEQCEGYGGCVDYLLFDTSTKAYGGSGHKFDWQILKSYNEQIPYILSGGITIDDIPFITQLVDNRLVGVDINSQFELSPALKNTKLVGEFITELKKQRDESHK